MPAFILRYRLDTIARVTNLNCTYLFKEHSCQLSPRSDLKPRSLRLFWRVSPQQEAQEQEEQQQDE